MLENVFIICNSNSDSGENFFCEHHVTSYAVSKVAGRPFVLQKYLVNHQTCCTMYKSLIIISRCFIEVLERNLKTVASFAYYICT